jgi:hypothetical protein
MSEVNKSQKKLIEWLPLLSDAKCSNILLLEIPSKLALYKQDFVSCGGAVLQKGFFIKEQDKKTPNGKVIIPELIIT